MQDILSKLDIFERLVDEDKIYIDRSITFSDICSMLQVSHEALDKALLERLGYTGNEIIREFRRQHLIMLKEKYGISF